PECILRRRVRLPLELQEIADRKILGFEPAQEHFVVRARSYEMDMIVAREPLGARPGGPILQAERDVARLSGTKLECLAGGNVEQPAICFQTIFSRRQIERCTPVQQKE